MHKPHVDDNATQHRTRFILLGASNATRGLPVLFESARRWLGPRVDMHAAIGHGRSFGASSRAMFRQLPGILDCDLWNALRAAHQRDPAQRTVALITDIGNDVIYGRSPEQLIEWLDTIIDRLSQYDAQLAITALPMQTIEAVPHWQARVVKWMTYPRRGLPVQVAIERARDVDAGVGDLARTRDIPLIAPDPTWYFLDPIHINSAQWPRAAAAMLAPLHDHDDAPLQPITLTRRLRLHTAMPARFHIAGIAMQRPQPIRRVDGSTLSLY